MACPVDPAFDPLADDYLADPYVVLGKYRAEQPVFFSAELDGFVVTRYADIDRILMDPETFSSANTVTPLWPVSQEAQHILAGAFKRVPTLSNADGERHARMRRYVAKVLSPRRFVSLRPTIEAQASGLLDRMLAKPVADVYADLAYPLPAMTAFSLLGFPEEDTELLKSWVTDRQQLTWGRPSPDEQSVVARNVVAFSDYIERFIRHRLAEPADDAVSQLLEFHRQDPEALTLNDVANIVFLLSAGAHESTTNLIVHATRRLLEHPEQWAAACEDPALIPNAVEEALRYDASAIMWPRVAARATSIGGVEIPAGARLLMALGGANHDSEAFDDPDRFSITREGARRHLSFGKGIHFCLGAPLARMEADAVLRLLASRAPQLRLVEGQSYPYQKNAVMRSPGQLLVRCEPAAGTAQSGGSARPSYRIVLDRDVCIGSGMCAAAAPAAFELDEEDRARATCGERELPVSGLEALAAQCPSGALRLVRTAATGTAPGSTVAGEAG